MVIPAGPFWTRSPANTAPRISFLSPRADRTRTALRQGNYRALILGGGVSLNSRLRQVLGQLCATEKVELLMAKPKYCGDNGAMIAALAYYRRNLSGPAAMHVDATPSLEIG